MQIHTEMKDASNGRSPKYLPKWNEVQKPILGKTGKQCVAEKNWLKKNLLKKKDLWSGELKTANYNSKSMRLKQAAADNFRADELDYQH